ERGAAPNAPATPGSSRPRPDTPRSPGSPTRKTPSKISSTRSCARAAFPWPRRSAPPLPTGPPPCAPSPTDRPRSERGYRHDRLRTRVLSQVGGQRVLDVGREFVQGIQAPLGRGMPRQRPLQHAAATVLTAVVEAPQRG